MVVAELVAAFELGIEVFGLDRSDVGLPRYRFDVCTARPGLIATTTGFSITVEHGLDRLGSADLVVVPARAGGQAQFVEAPVPTSTGNLREFLEWAAHHLAEPLTGEARRPGEHVAADLRPPFPSATGTTPHDWLVGQRLLRAEQLLEETGLGIEEIARRSGLGSAYTLRHHFLRRRGISPSDYRSTFHIPTGPPTG